jgi:hypothetical protein
MGAWSVDVRGTAPTLRASLFAFLVSISAPSPSPVGDLARLFSTRAMCRYAAGFDVTENCFIFIIPEFLGSRKAYVMRVSGGHLRGRGPWPWLLAAACLLLPACIRADVCGKPSKESWEGECSKSAVSVLPARAALRRSV